MNLQRIFDRYNGDNDFRSDAPPVWWAEMDLATAMVELENRIAALEARCIEPVYEALELQRDAGWLEDKLPTGEPIGKDLDKEGVG